jgi:hypothetical protein
LNPTEDVLRLGGGAKPRPRAALPLEEAVAEEGVRPRVFVWLRLAWTSLGCESDVRL